MQQGTLRRPQDVIWSDTGEAIPGNDPRALNYRQLSAVGAIDTSQPAGTLRNPKVLRSAGDEEGLRPNEVYMDLKGQVRFAPTRDDVQGEFGDSPDAMRLTGPQTGRLTDIPLWQFQLNPSEQSRIEVIQRNIPDAEFSRTPDGRVVVRVGQGPWRYMNAPGVSGQDIGDFLTQGVLYAPTGIAARGATTLGQGALRTGTASAGVSALQDIATGQPIDPVKAGLAFAGGAGGEYLGAAVGGLARATGQAASQAVPQPVRNALAPAIDDARRAVGQSFGADARASVQNPLAQIPMSRGQQTGNYGQIAFEQAAARGARGEEASNIMRGFFDEQAAAVRSVGRNMAGSETVPSIPAAGRVVQQGVRDAQVAAKARVDDAYDLIRQSDAMVSAPNVAKLPERIRARLEEDFFSPEVMTSLNPRTTRIFGEIERLAKSAPDKDYSLPVAGLERVRQALNAARATAQGNDQTALGIAKKEFDAWLGETVDQGLMKGDPNTIAMLKNARGLHADYRATFGGGRANNGAQRLMQRLISANANETDAANLLFGQAQLGGAGETVQFVRMVKKAAQSKEVVDALREGAVMRLLGRMDRQAGGGATNFNYKVIADDWAEALDGKAAPLMRELFTPQEIAEMRRFVGQVRRLAPPEGAVNRSGTGYEMGRMASQLLGKLKILAPALKAMDDASNATRAQTAVAPGVPLPRLPGAGPAGAGLGAASGGEKANVEQPRR
jgi:hypothetical protein